MMACVSIIKTGDNIVLAEILAQSSNSVLTCRRLSLQHGGGDEMLIRRIPPTPKPARDTRLEQPVLAMVTTAEPKQSFVDGAVAGPAATAIAAAGLIPTQRNFADRQSVNGGSSGASRRHPCSSGLLSHHSHLDRRDDEATRT
jgi:hypothetical protein